MDESYWHNKWEENNIGFHEKNTNGFLVKHFSALDLAKGSRVFLPLCGKTLDISWFLSSSYQVVGAEFSKLAVDQLFSQLGIEPIITSEGELERYHAKDITIFVGDIFNVSRERLGIVDAVYDRAALVALSGDLRNRYTEHLMKITQLAPQLLICFEYEKTLMDGPPFSIRGKDVEQYYNSAFDLTLLESKNVAGKFKGKVEAIETAWLLQKRIVL